MAVGNGMKDFSLQVERFDEMWFAKYLLKDSYGIEARMTGLSYMGNVRVPFEVIRDEDTKKLESWLFGDFWMQSCRGEVSVIIRIFYYL